MTDSVAVFPAGYRLTDSTTGAPMSGAVIEFYDAGTTNPKTVYADSGLTVELGTSVTTDALGYPTSDGSTKTLIYVGTAAYKVRIETSTGVLIAEHDNVKGAVETFDSTDQSVTATQPVETKSLDYTVVVGDQSKAFAGNCTGGDVTFTMPSAATAGNGWFCTISHAGSANQVRVATVSSQTITSGATSYGTAFVLSNSGEQITLVSDGGNWRVIHHIGPHIKRGQGVLTIVDRLTSAPGGPVEGALYIATAGATWGSTAVLTHDVVMHTVGGAYVKFTPPTDCGWVAFVQDENLNYQFKDSAWVAENATDSAPGTVELATAAEMVTATDTGRVPSVATLRNHPGVAKVVGKVVYAAGVPTLQAGSYNVTSITDTAQGRLTVTIADDFSTANYTVVAMCEGATSDTRAVGVSSGTQAAGSFELYVVNQSANLQDPVAIHFACYGTLA